MAGAQWWREAVVYQVYPRSFADANGDGEGDLRGVVERMPYLASLGVQELGLPNVDDLPDDVLQDPVFRRTGGRVRGRDGCRVPLPWSGTTPPFGFSPDGVETWLPMPAAWRDLTVEAQEADPGSMLALYRRALALRRAEPSLRGGTVRWLDDGAPSLATLRSAGRRPAGVASSWSRTSATTPRPCPPARRCSPASTDRSTACSPATRRRSWRFPSRAGGDATQDVSRYRRPVVVTGADLSEGGPSPCRFAATTSKV